jgi:hypothetical protein
MRTTSETFGAWMDEALGGYQIDEERQPYYSIVAAEPDPSKPRSVKDFHILYGGTAKLIRTLHLPSLASTLLSELQSLTYPQRDDAIYAALVPISSKSAAAVVPVDLVPFLGALGRRVHRAGLSLPAVRAVAIDPDSGHLMPVPQLLEIPEDAIEMLGKLLPANGRSDRTSFDNPLSPQVVLAGYFQSSDETLQPLSRAQAVHALTPSVLNLEKVGGAALDALVRVVDRARCYAVKGSALEMLDGVKNALRAA